MSGEPIESTMPEAETGPLGPPPKRAPSVKFLTLEDIANLPDLEWLIDDLVPEASMVVPFGSPKAGKSFIIQSMLLHIAAGKDWMGRKTKQGAIVYIVGEGARGLKARFEAMRKHYDISGALPFYTIERAVNFMDATAVRYLAEDIEELMAAEGHKLAAVAVDTVARAMPGADENSSKEMGVFVSACDKVREHLGCTMFGIHHAGKDVSRGARGSNSLLGAVDAEYKVERKDRVTTLTVTDMRDGESGEVMTFDMLKVSTSNGKSTLVPVLRAEAATGSAPTLAEVKLTKSEKQAMSALEEALKAYGVQQPSGNRTCTVEDWRQTLYSKMAADKPDTKLKAFRRSLRDLQAHNLIEVADPLVWLKSSDHPADGFIVDDLHDLFNGARQTAPSTSIPQ